MNTDRVQVLLTGNFAIHLVQCFKKSVKKKKTEQIIGLNSSKYIDYQLKIQRFIVLLNMCKKKNHSPGSQRFA